MNIEHNTDVFFIEFERKLFLKQKDIRPEEKCDTIKERQGENSGRDCGYDRKESRRNIKNSAERFTGGR